LADVRFGTSPTPPVVAANISISPNSTKTYTLPALSPGTTYYWQIVSKTVAQQGAAGEVYSFTTAGGDPPPPPPPPPSGLDVVLHTVDATRVAGTWVLEGDTSAASGRKIRHADAGGAKLTAPLAAPSNYFELTFTADAGRPYHLWIRGRADGNSYSNDSVFVQFSDSVNASGAPTYRIGTTAATDFNLEACSGCGLSGWGWEDNGWGPNVTGPRIYFAATGTHTIRIQTREDGLAIDQVVLSADAYLSTSPGATRNDTVILPKSSSTPPPPPPPPPSGEIVLHAARATQVVGNWSIVSDTSAASGQRIYNPNAAAAKVVTPLANPSTYFELTFNAEAGRPYRLWIRARADSNNYANDSVHVQFSGSVNQSGTAVYGIGTATSTEFNLEACSGCGLANWGWEDNGWGSGVMGPVIYFAATGPQTLRVQPREDGISIDQIVLSPAVYLNAAPGLPRNDTRILPQSQ
jgi:hypothetical protein